MAAFAVVLLAAGLGGYGLLRLVGLAPEDAWGGGRVAGLAAAVLPAWWAGSLGWHGWFTLAAGTGVVLAIHGGVRAVRDRSWRRLAAPEAAFWIGALAVGWMRAPHPAILDTEKLMDLGILATLLRTQGFPPPDMWLAGHSLPYYYWGSLLWAVPLEVSGAGLAVGYNLTAAAIGGTIVAVAYRIAVRLSGSWRTAVAGTFLAVFAGTASGWFQALGGGIDLWAASRTVPDTITEFPLFTLWLGDLHPHLLSMPLALLALLLALPDGGGRPRAGRVAAVAVAFGLTWAANPWAMPVTLAAVSALLVAFDGRWRWPWEDPARWIPVPAVTVGGWLVAAPFHLAYRPPFHGLGLVHAWTAPDRLLAWGGVLLVPAAGLAVRELALGIGGDRERRRALTLALGAALVTAAAISGRPTAVLLAGMLLPLVSRGLASGREPAEHRAAVLLAALGVFLLLVPEVLYVRDPYGGALHRMNTVFKAYIQAWPLLGLTAPVSLAGWAGGRRFRAILAALVLAAAPQTAWVLAAPAGAPSLGLDGLRWMTDGDRRAVAVLRRLPPGAVLAEAPGGAYGREGRLSAASGVPAVLGWENHERVWRGPAVGPELARRKAFLDRLYGTGSPAAVREAVSEYGVTVVAVGAIERERYPESGIARLLAAGRHLTDGGTVLVALEAVR